MVTYIGTKKIGSISDYNSLSNSEKVIASRSPSVKQILTGSPTASSIIRSQNSASKAIKIIQDQNKSIMDNFESNYLNSWINKFAGANQPITASTLAAPITSNIQEENTNMPGWLIPALLVAALVVLK